MGYGTLKDKGFTLVEVLIAMAISLVVLGAVYSLYAYFIRSTTGQEKLLEIQQEGRAAMERLSKEVRVAGCYYRNAPIITATSSRFEFESDTDPDPTKGPWMINYALDSTNKELVRNDAAWGGAAYGAYSASQTVSSHVKALSFVYYDENGAVIASPVASGDLSKIRRVDVALTTETDVINPSTNKKDSIDLNTSLYLRCMGVQQSTDTTPCAYPTNVAAADTGTCGWANITWTKSASTDAAGYKVYYRPSGAAFYTGVVDVGGGATQQYTLKGLSNGVSYDIVMKCVDTSGNVNPEDVNSLIPVTVSLNDTAAPDNPTAVDATSAASAVNLTWTPSTAPDTGGYYVYRSDDAGSTYTRIVEIDSTNISYSDTTVTNCPTTPFYYKVISWDCAQTDARTLVSLGSQSSVYGDGAKAGADIPTGGVTDTTPVETTAPDDPVNFNAVAGADRIYLSYATPASTDLKGVRILKRSDQYPSDKDDASASGPNTVKDYEPLSPSQTYALIDQNAPPANPINIGTTYFYRAFAYDVCMNYSAGTISQATAKPCGDGTAGPPPAKHFGPPSAPTGLTPTVCGTASLNWTASAGSENGNLFDTPDESDVVGYYVYRSTSSGGPYANLNPGAPVTSTSYADSTVATGNNYFYVVTAVDCADKESTVYSSEVSVRPTDLAWNNASDKPVTTNCCSIDAATSVVLPGTTGSQHNIVKFFFKNLGTSTVTVNSITATWTAATANIKSVTLKPQGGTRVTVWNDTTLPLTPSGGTADFTPSQPAASRQIPALSTDNELVIEFRDGTDTAAPDMRGSTLNVTLNYTNDAAASICASSSFSVPVPLGPVIGSTAQNKPASPTASNLTPGSSATTVPYGTQDAAYAWTFNTVNFSATVTPDSGTTLSYVKYYYAKTGRTTSSAPSSDYSAAPTGWTVVNMANLSGTDVYETGSVIPSSSSPGTRFWYYIVAADSNGNTDIQPEPVVGVYTFDIEPKFNITQYVGRLDGDAGTAGNDGQYIYLWYYVTDSHFDTATGGLVSTPIAGATVTATIARSTGGIAPTTATVPEYDAVNFPGWYYYTYTADTKFKNHMIDVSVAISKAGITSAACGKANLPVDTPPWDIKTCN